MLQRIKNILRRIFYVDIYNANKERIELEIEEEYEKSIPELPEELVIKLKSDLDGDLYVLEIHDDDITSMQYVVKIIQKFSKRKDREQACELMLKVHASGRAQLLAGSKENMEQVKQHIIKDARSRKFPLQLVVVRA